MKALETLAKLSRIVSLILDPNFTATHPSIAADLSCSDRQVRNYFCILDELGAPLVNHGRLGWELGEWNLWAALELYISKPKTKQGNRS